MLLYHNIIISDNKYMYIVQYIQCTIHNIGNVYNMQQQNIIYAETRLTHNQTQPIRMLDSIFDQ